MTVRITSRNARFQQWESLLHNRTKRHRLGELVVQGVRPISLAIEHGWTIRALISDGRPRMSAWAAGVWGTTDAERVVMAPELVAELGEKDEPSELLAIVGMPADDLSRLDPTGLTVVFDRPTQPGNIGTLARSADAFGATGLVVTGHAADPYDPRAVRASTGSLFALTVVRAPSHREVLDWARPEGVRVVGTDETGTTDLRAADLTRSPPGGRRQRDVRDDRGLAGGVRRARVHPDGRLGELPQRRDRRLDRARRGGPPASGRTVASGRPGATAIGPGPIPADVRSSGSHRAGLACAGAQL